MTNTRDVDARTDDQKFEDWLANQKPPLKLASLSAEERREQRKAFDWESRFEPTEASAAVESELSELKLQRICVGLALLGAVGLIVVWLVLSWPH